MCALKEYDWIGLGVGANHHRFIKTEGHVNTANPLWLLIPIIGWAVIIASDRAIEESLGTYFAPYVTIPLGFRFTPRVFTIGAGATVNIPLQTDYSYYSRETVVSDPYYDIYRPGRYYP
jgi:hypothetical protein